MVIESKTIKTARSRAARRFCVPFVAVGAMFALTPFAAADPCPDINSDGILDNGDLFAFVQQFIAKDFRTDFNEDGFLDNADIGAFVSMFLVGAPCAPEVIAQGGALAGTVGVVGSTPPTFLKEHYLAEPSVIEPLQGSTSNSVVLAVGTDTDGARLLVIKDVLSHELWLDRENGGREQITMAGDGVAYPVEMDTLSTSDPEFIYQPVAAKVHDGLLMVLCNTHWYRGVGDVAISQNWDWDNTVSLLWRNIDDTQWNIVRDAHNPTVGLFGAVWAMGVPIIPEDGTLLIGWTNYQWKLQGNGSNNAFLSSFERGPDGRWSHSVSLDLFEDGSAPGDQHFHTVQPYWTGTELRVFIAVGDGVDFNGIYEYYRGDLEIGASAVPKPGAQEIMLAGSGWTDAGYVHGGKALDGFNRPGMQPTYMLPINGRIHCGGDESIPAVASFDPNRPGGTLIDDFVSEYLPHSPDLDSGLGWNSLTGDVNDYANPTAAAAMVQPSPSWAGDSERANRVIFYDGQGWSSVANLDTKMTFGLGIGPGNNIVVGTTGGSIEVQPGVATRFTPLISSVGATNLITDPDWMSVVIGQTRAMITDITDDAALVGPNSFLPGTQVLRLEINTDPAWVGSTFAKILAPDSNRSMLVENDQFQFRYWIRPLGGMGLNARIVPIEADTGAPLIKAESGAAIATTDRFFPLTNNDWMEFLNYGEVLEPLGIDPFGLGFQLQSRQLNGVSAAFQFDMAVEGIYVNAVDMVTQRPGFGQTLPDTNHIISLSDATLPLTVSGITQPLGASGKQHALRQTRNLCTLWLNSDNYLSVDSYFSSNHVRYVGKKNGEFFFGAVSDVEWSRATPIAIRFDIAGADLTIQVSTYGGPWSDPVIVEGFGSIPWTDFQLFGVSTQSHLGMASLRATPKSP